MDYMKAKLIVYSVKHLSVAAQNQLRKAINGHNDVSHGKRYRYRREGLLDKLVHLKPSRNTILAPLKEAEQILDVLIKLDAKIKTYNLEMNKSEFKK